MFVIFNTMSILLVESALLQALSDFIIRFDTKINDF